LVFTQQSPKYNENFTKGTQVGIFTMASIKQLVTLTYSFVSYPLIFLTDGIIWQILPKYILIDSATSTALSEVDLARLTRLKPPFQYFVFKTFSNLQGL
jgi:hypothetical protein